jgi:hypothetical protein
LGILTSPYGNFDYYRELDVVVWPVCLSTLAPIIFDVTVRFVAQPSKDIVYEALCKYNEMVSSLGNNS